MIFNGQTNIYYLHIVRLWFLIWKYHSWFGSAPSEDIPSTIPSTLYNATKRPQSSAKKLTARSILADEDASEEIHSVLLFSVASEKWLSSA